MEKIKIENARKAMYVYYKQTEATKNYELKDIYVSNVFDVYSNEKPQIRIVYHLKGERYKVLMSQFDYFNLLNKYENGTQS